MKIIAYNRRILPPCSDLIREVEEMYRQGAYDKAPQSLPLRPLLLPSNQDALEPPRSLSDTEYQFNATPAHGHTPNMSPHQSAPNWSFPTVPHIRPYIAALHTPEAPPLKLPPIYSLGSKRSEKSKAKSKSGSGSDSSSSFDLSSSDWFNESHSSASSLSAPPASCSSKKGAKTRARAQEERYIECSAGKACIRAAHEALLERFASCSFETFGVHPPVPHSPSHSSSSPRSSSTASTSVLPPQKKLGGAVHTTVAHDPAAGAQHFCMEVRAPSVEFRVAGAGAGTRGVAVVDILKFGGQCVVRPAEDVVGVLTSKDQIDLVIEWKGFEREVVSIPVRCACGYEITKGQLALEISRAHSKYFATQKCADNFRGVPNITTSIAGLRLMSLHTDDGGKTWRAQHAIVEEISYEEGIYETVRGRLKMGVAIFAGQGVAKRQLGWVGGTVGWAQGSLMI